MLCKWLRIEANCVEVLRTQHKRQNSVTKRWGLQWFQQMNDLSRSSEVMRLNRPHTTFSCRSERLCTELYTLYVTSLIQSLYINSLCREQGLLSDQLGLSASRWPFLSRWRRWLQHHNMSTHRLKATSLSEHSIDIRQVRLVNAAHHHTVQLSIAVGTVWFIHYT